MEADLEPAIKLTVSVGGDEQRGHRSLYEEVLRVLRAEGLTEATLTRGIMSYGCRRVIHSTMNEITIENLPIIIEVIGEQTKVEAAANLIAELLSGHGLVEFHTTTVVRHASTERQGERTNA